MVGSFAYYTMQFFFIPRDLTDYHILKQKATLIKLRRYYCVSDYKT